MRWPFHIGIKSDFKSGSVGYEKIPPDWTGQLQLLVIQPSPFCNLDCDYCYLPDRNNTIRMELKTLEIAAKKIFSANLPARDLSVVWHAGEPLVVSKDWYESAFDILSENCSSSVRITHNFQTNGVLIDTNWISFFRNHDVRLGVSLDGPAWLHDKHRRTRDFRGTHARVMKGIDKLKETEMPFHVICVLTRESLDHPDEIFDFFSNLKPQQLCFNIEEVEAANSTSSLATNHLETEKAFRIFMTQIVKRASLLRNDHALLNDEISSVKERPTESVNRRMRIREIDDIIYALRHPAFGKQKGNSQNIPGQILNLASDGRFSTFSPELLGQIAPNIGDLSLGNVHFDQIPPNSQEKKYVLQWEAIQEGVKRCKETCSYFDLCLGGSPSNKLGETESFESTETLYCKLTKKIMIEVVLNALDNELPHRDLC